MAAPGAAPSPQTRALFDALLAGDTEAALALLQGPEAAQLAHTGPAGFTSLHAAVAGRGGADALAALLAAGAPLEGKLSTTLFWPSWHDNHGQPGALEQLQPFVSAGSLDALQARCSSVRGDMTLGSTPLALAVRLREVASARRLLQLGAAPNAGFAGLSSSSFIKPGHVAPVVRQLLSLLLQHGANCLLSSPYSISFLNLHGWSGLEGALLSHLERQRTAGTLHLGSTAEVFELAKGAVRAGHCPLLGHALGCLEQRLGAAPEEPLVALAPAHARPLGWLLLEALDQPASKAVPALQALLASPLPCVASATACSRCPLLGRAASHGRAVREAVLPLLRQAGASLAMADVLYAVQARSSAALAALLAYGIPAVDMLQPGVPVREHSPAYSCPVQELLRQSTCPALNAQSRWEVTRMLEMLLAAGYRLTVYHDVAPPAFLGRGSQVLPVFDPLDFHPGNLEDPLVFLARGGTWSPAEHHRWPDAFKAAARTLLLACSAAGAQPLADAAVGGSKRRRRRGHAAGDIPTVRGGRLAELPAGVLLRVVELAATPMSAWL
ncbi:hypothetical protein ABPG75_006665 [Micractinium tetrahymenae]